MVRLTLRLRISLGIPSRVAEIDRYRPDDRSAVDALYLRVFGDAAAESYRQRWEWLYSRNPNLPDGSPLIWLAREGAAIVGQYATMPVRLSVNGVEIDAAWGTDFMIAPERQRLGLGKVLLENADRNVGASLWLSLTDASHAMWTKMQRPDLGRIPRLAKPLSRRALSVSRDPNWRVETAKIPWRRVATRLRPLGGVIRKINHFDHSFTELWERVGPRFAFAVRRDAAYLNWRFVHALHAQYSIGACMRNGDTAGYVVLRHVAEPRWRVTIVVDFLADPGDSSAMMTLLRWVDREALAANSDLIRAQSTHVVFNERFRKSGYYDRKRSMRFVAKINAVQVPLNFYDSVDEWHVTFGDSDADR